MPRPRRETTSAVRSPRSTPGPARAPRRVGLGALRRSGTVSDLLFLYECATRDVGPLRPVAERLGLTVQAASHTSRSLVRRGWLVERDGRYRPTVAGVDWLHTALGTVRDDLAERLDRLHIVRTTRAIAASRVRSGEVVALSLEDGVLTARAGGGSGSRGRAQSGASKGEFVEVGELEGIVPLPLGRLFLTVLPSDRLSDPRLAEDLARALRRAGSSLWCAFGLEAFHLLGKAAPRRPVVRFGVGAAVLEATRLGVDCAVVVLDREVPRLFDQLAGPESPAVEFLPIGARSGSGGRSPARRQ